MHTRLDDVLIQNNLHNFMHSDIISMYTARYTVYWLNLERDFLKRTTVLPRNRIRHILL